MIDPDLFDTSPAAMDAGSKRDPATTPEEKTIERLAAISEGMTDWEVNFAESVIKQFDSSKKLSPKQWTLVHRILDKN